MTYVFLHLSEYTSHISRHRFFYLNNIVCIVNIWLLVIVNFVKPYMYMLQILLDINNVIHIKSTTLISQENHLIETCQLFTIHVIKQTSNVGKKDMCNCTTYWSLIELSLCTLYMVTAINYVRWAGCVNWQFLWNTCKNCFDWYNTLYHMRTSLVCNIFSGWRHLVDRVVQWPQISWGFLVTL